MKTLEEAIEHIKELENFIERQDVARESVIAELQSEILELKKSYTLAAQQRDEMIQKFYDIAEKAKHMHDMSSIKNQKPNYSDYSNYFGVPL